MKRSANPITIKGPSGRIYQMYPPEGGDHQARHWERGAFYESRKGDVLTWAYQNPQYFKRVVDVGASLGNHSVFFAGELGAEVLPIEPYTADICQYNLHTNGVKAKVRQFVVGKPGRYQLVPGPEGNVGMASFEPAGMEGFSIASRTLSFLCHPFEPTAIKIDAEGAAVFYNSFKYLASRKPLIIIEETDAARVAAYDVSLTSHKRIDQVFNATPTHIYLPL